MKTTLTFFTGLFLGILLFAASVIEGSTNSLVECQQDGHECVIEWVRVKEQSK